MTFYDAIQLSQDNDFSCPLCDCQGCGSNAELGPIAGKWLCEGCYYNLIAMEAVA